MILFLHNPHYEVRINVIPILLMRKLRLGMVKSMSMHMEAWHQRSLILGTFCGPEHQGMQQNWVWKLGANQSVLLGKSLPLSKAWYPGLWNGLRAGAPQSGCCMVSPRWWARDFPGGPVVKNQPQGCLALDGCGVRRWMSISFKLLKLGFPLPVNPGIELTEFYVSCILYYKLYLGSPVSQAICTRKHSLLTFSFLALCRKSYYAKKIQDINLEAQLKGKCGPDALGHLRKYGSCFLSICYLLFWVLHSTFQLIPCRGFKGIPLGIDPQMIFPSVKPWYLKMETFWK